ncbi:MAG: hypothetical protein IJA41_10655 [Clostridia bacterium]|nr:hypothetical protein [Clostridia bacterium]
MGMVLRLKKSILAAVGVLVAVGITVGSQAVREGVKKGLVLCADKVLPSLFLFTAVALFIAYSGIADTVGRVVSPATKALFGLDGQCATVWLLAAVSGYPVGARLINTLYENGTVTRAKALKMLTFSVNAGPAFIVTAVGSAMLESTSDGVRLLIVHLLATVILTATVRFLPDRRFSPPHRQPQALKKDLCPAVSDAFVRAVGDAASTMLTVSAFVVVFSGLGGLLSYLPQSVSRVVTMLSEVTVGLTHCTRQDLPLAAFLLGFGGISVIFQVTAAAHALQPPLRSIFLSRLAHGALSAGLIAVAEVVFPRSISTGTFGTTAAVHTSPLAAASLVVLCLVLLSFIHNSSSTEADLKKY